MDPAREASIGECPELLPSSSAQRSHSRHILRKVASQVVTQTNPPVGIVFTTLLYCGELASACVVSFAYSRSEDIFWLSLTLLLMLIPSVMDQFTLIFVHRDLTSDKPFIFFMHLVLLGPPIRCLEAIVIFYRLGREEEPYVTITRKKHIHNNSEFELEQEVGHSVRRLVTHRNAFKRMAVIQAFLGSTPQLTLQLYVSVVEQYVPTSRAVLMCICLLSVTYGALVCNVLAIQIKYDDYKIRLGPLGFICIILWRSLEISTRITILVLFGSVFKQYAMAVGGASFLVFFFLPWVQFWKTGSRLPDHVEKNFSWVGTVTVLCTITLLYAGINVFCWSAVQLTLADRDLIAKSQNWGCLVLYYVFRGVENIVLVLAWYFFKTDVYEYVCTPMLVLQLMVAYCMAIMFMLFFMQYLHPCRRLFTHNISDFLQCVCCKRAKAVTPLHLEPPWEPGVRHSIV
ncbi:XK-related protein 2 [Sceloporus undulatus]|uniref:XK-related protein 2 n=1 Tax=Sceloporus undulatus TaxID=8520 RepID=UPI001C4D1C81|nr:XK-related protein 2 [Sceloporus undulatus]XP_042335948.1 XK-related protein 2 [Sceloporus undulatus]